MSDQTRAAIESYEPAFISEFNYATAGGSFVPTREQYEAAIAMERAGIDVMQATALQGAYLAQAKVSHDIIHVINEYRRSLPTI